MAIYLDHAATTPMLPAVIDSYTTALGLVGNPSSIHSQGQNAKRMLEEARESVAASVNADSVEVTFTSGGTEAVNLAVKGLFWARQGATPRPRILSTRAEHHATIDALEWLEQHEGAVIDWVPVSSTGRIDLAYLEAALADDVALVTTLWANNEVGTVQPIDAIVALASARGIPVHADAVSAYGYLPIDFHASGLAAMSISAHKIGGPVGIGALVIARSATVTPLVHGGNQQRSRSGTMDAAGSVAFGVAAAHIELDRVQPLRDRLIEGVRAAVPEAILRGDPAGRLPGNAHFTFPGCEGDSLLFLLDVAGFSVSTGSACQAGVPEASHVLLAMGLDEPTARGALRITLGHSTTAAEVDAFVAALPAAVARARTAGYADRETQLGH
ncbi:cysteine desulfurase family protein [Salinibacterium sp. G-O1]|uniref:cysteine desulfurase family protein n=1 Tax=Salinibacterium sp. G-O1 TaxID=3046208 RepID=UPI0024B8AB81|nr:cysteine desulfurase family protein [Salinibacterium sp. G-O1]MDJ0335648.1 cysteine desulfurase family protein [Salinibacterium sp. G-O1]